jgi:hypothetical protein
MWRNLEGKESRAREVIEHSRSLIRGEGKGRTAMTHVYTGCRDKIRGRIVSEDITNTQDVAPLTSSTPLHCSPSVGAVRTRRPFSLSP